MSILKYFHNAKKNKITQQEHKYERKLPEQIKLSLDLVSNIETIKRIMGYANDITVREFTITPGTETKAAVVLVRGLAERELINEQVIGALMSNDRFNSVKNNMEFFKMIKECGIPNISVNEEFDVNTILNELINGNTIFFLDKVDKALVVGSTGWRERAVSEPTTENVVRGPKDGFTENIENNTALIRRRIKSPNLRIEPFKIGTKTKTTILIVYLEGIIKEVRSRLKRIEIDSIQ